MLTRSNFEDSYKNEAERNSELKRLGCRKIKFEEADESEVEGIEY